MLNLINDDDDDDVSVGYKIQKWEVHCTCIMYFAYAFFTSFRWLTLSCMNEAIGMLVDCEVEYIESPPSIVPSLPCADI